jgi:hypothetical protein
LVGWKHRPNIAALADGIGAKWHIAKPSSPKSQTAAPIRKLAAKLKMSESRHKRIMPIPGSDLYPLPNQQRHLRLFLPKYLEEEANRPVFEPAELERASAALRQWADMAQAGQLRQKETSLDSEFLQKIFGEALNYKSVSESPLDYHREKNPTVPGAGIADGALGLFVSGKSVPPTVIIELKGSTVDLDHDKFNGRTPVQQCWDYLNQLPDTQWGIVSNYVKIRLYHKGSPARAYEEFTVADFLDPARFRQFYFLFEKDGLVGGRITKPRALKLLKRTQTQQREIGDKLYVYYADQRERLIGELMDRKGMPQDHAIHAAQRLLDRVIFMAFCEDRGLLPEKLIESTWKNVAPLARATNPRWRNFLDAFHAIDQGHASLDLPTGYNGGLFKHDDVVDNLDLDDRWADVFMHIGTYDFREEGEISVDVLGHIFERSITELEKLRTVGLFGKQAEKALAAMPKSAERKRFGIYYTPPQFTRLIVEETLGKLIAERVDPLPDLGQRITELRKLKIVDPACGSGAFLIAAYERLEDAYEEIARQMRIAGRLQDALNLTNAYADYILTDNLFGVDLSAESVEITQLALWIRSARKGRTLADLSANIRRGNSLIRDKSVHPEAFDWHAAFPKVKVFAGGGFDVVIGNPPWERLKVQEREFFSLAAPEIASTANAADRRKLVTGLETANPPLWARYESAMRAAEAALDYVRTPDAGFPLSGRGDVNTYMLFAELARTIGASNGRIGLLVPSGIATDNTTKEFFADLVESKTLVAIYDFVNRLGLFPDVEGRLKFCVLLINGRGVKHENVDFVFFAEKMEELSEAHRHIKLTAKDLKLLNPNTHTCPVFRSRTDADLTKRIYRSVPIFVDRNRKTGGNPWQSKFSTMFHATNDAEFFETPARLKASGHVLEGNRWRKGKKIFLTLYEAKMTRDYDHRATKVQLGTGNWYMNYEAESSTLVEHQNPEFLSLGRWWVSEDEVASRADHSLRTAAIGFHDIARSTDRRTMVACMVPWAAVSNKLPMIINAGNVPWRRFCCLLGNLNSLPYDFVARQKVGGANLNFFIVEQIPTLPPDAYDGKCPWAKSKKLEDWIADRVLKLTCAADDMRPLAEAANFVPGVWKWKEAERAQLRAELDAAYFHLYGLSREDVEYILGTFQGIVNEDEKAEGEGATRRSVLDAYDTLA